MNTSAISEALHALLARMPATTSSEEERTALAALAHAAEDPGDGSSLLGLLEAEPSLSPYAQRMVRVFGNGAGSMGFNGLLHWLVPRAHEVGVAQALQELDESARSATFPCRMTLAASGFHLDAAIDLGDGVIAMPLTWQDFPVGSPRDRSVYGRPISFGLEMPFDHPKVYTPPDGGARESKSARAVGMKCWGDAIRDLEDARLCLSVSAQGASKTIGYLMKTDASTPSAGASGQAEGPSAPSPRHDLTASEGVDAKAFHLAFRGLTESTKRALRVPMERLVSAMARAGSVGIAVEMLARREVDIAIDLGIALESLLLTDNDVAELVDKLSLHGARYMADTLEERRALRTTFKRLYKTRSAAIHRGVVPNTVSGGAGLSSAQLLRDGIVLVGDLLRKIVLSGDLPDWEKIELQ